MIIRNIQAQDNKKIEAIVKSTIVEFGLPTEGSAYEDSDTQNMFEAYEGNNACYFVLEHNDEVIGGGGIKPLQGENNEICELQKMYFSEEARGKGIGKQMLKECLDTAKSFGFGGCYLETMPYMDAAQKLYNKHGFVHIDAPMGCTGHTSCPVYMYRKI